MGHFDIYYSHQQIKRAYDFIISFLYPHVIPQDVLEKGRININFHPASSDYPGTGCYNFALYEEAPEYGAVAHHMLPLVDSGKIIMEERFSIEKNDSIESLQLKTHASLYKLFTQFVEEIGAGKEEWAEVAQWKRKPTTRKQLNAMCYIDDSMDEGEIIRRYRAFHHPKFPICYRKGALVIELGKALKFS